VLWPVRAALAAGARKVVVVGGRDRALAPVLPEGVELAVQPEPDGTGGAVRAAGAHLDRDAPVVVLSGDVPLVTPEAIAELTRSHAAARAAATLVTMVLDDPGSYGRVVRDEDGAVARVVEAKEPGDASAEELALHEVNAGVYAFEGGALLDALSGLSATNAQGELYLPDVIAAVRERGAHVASHRSDDPALVLGVNDRADLAAVAAHARRRINTAHMRAGVTLDDPAATYIDAEVTIGEDTAIAPGCVLMAGTRIGRDCRIGPHATLADTTLGDRVTVIHSHAYGVALEEGATVGPFASLRPGTVLRERAKAGTFVELKGTDVGAGAKVPHLSYVGDTTIGPDSNLGASTITANYDGRRKHRTTIGARVHTAVDTTFVAPVEIGDDAYTGAGSVITEDVPAGALGIARARQVNLENYAERVRAAVSGD
jgi:bifunctional UDP-N-acetylglucosamine pyrophosphorylase/glucosamine-1-phosphate N-acetyltransferase